MVLNLNNLSVNKHTGSFGILTVVTIRDNQASLFYFLFKNVKLESCIKNLKELVPLPFILIVFWLDLVF